MSRLRAASPLTLLVPLAFALGGCGIVPGLGAPKPVPVDTVLVRDTSPPLAVHWARSSAEHRAVYIEIYRMAEARLREASVAYQPGSWAVILDADETVLDNSAYQKRVEKNGEGYSPTTWNAWVREEAAPALPGAGDFIRYARELGGRVVIVTNRDAAVCPETRETLRKLGMMVDLVLCKPQGQSSKEPRFRAVQDGTASDALPPLQVLMWVGDNIEDFPGLDQDVRRSNANAFDDFGRRFIVLPNPMYGSWVGNPYD